MRLEQVFSPQEIEQLGEELDYIICNFADWNAAWRSSWRKDYVDDPPLVERVKLVAISR